MNFRKYSLYTLVIFIVAVFVLRMLKVSPYIMIFTYTVFPAAIITFTLVDKYFKDEQ